MTRLILAFVLPALLALAMSPLPAHSETLQGTPLLRRFLPEEYRATPQNWSIAADREGRLFVGNDAGVLRYDGTRWDLIELPGRQMARKVVLGEDGRIYVGSHDSFGWLQATAQGGMQYRELLTAAALKGRDRDVGAVWQVLPTASGVYFRGEHALHFLDYQHRHAKRWPLEDSQRAIYAIGEQLYARIEGVGFSRFVNGRFEREPGGEMFASRRLLGVIAQPGWRLLVGDEGFHRADDRGIRALPDDAGAELRDHDPYTVMPLADGSFVVGTLGGDVLRYRRDGRLRERFNLGRFGIVALGTDREHGLWAATEGDLVRLSIPSPWSALSAAHGVPGGVYDFEWHDDALWLATTRGLLRMWHDGNGQTRTTPIPWLDFEGFALAGTDSGLLIAHRDGLMVLDAGAAVPRSLSPAPEPVRELLASRLDANRVYALGDSHLFVLERRLGRWQLGLALPLQGTGARTLVETGPGQVWFGDSRGAPQRWTWGSQRGEPPRKELFGEAQGLALDPAFGSKLFMLDGNVHAISGSRAYRFTGARFVADAGAPASLTDRPDQLSVQDTPHGTYAATPRQLWFRATGHPGWQPLHLGSPLAAGFRQLRHNADGVVRVATWNGLLQFDPSEPQPPPATLTLAFEPPAIDRVDGQPHGLAADGQPALLEIASGQPLRVGYGMVSLDSRPEYRHRVQRDGRPDAWSPWSDRSEVARTDAAGDYQLTVEARTASGRSATPIQLRYRILPPWYAQWWALLGGALLVIGMTSFAVHAFVRRRTRRYAEANRQLEDRIGERTRDLEALNRQLAELATEDALTGIPNRRAMQNGLQREWVRCLDQRRPLSVLMIDVDHFKRYNDTLGHLEGDVLLRRIAQTLRDLHDPKRELLARFGGEEFALLLPGITQGDARDRAEQIRVAMQDRVREITISIGVAGFVPNAEGDSEDLLRRADAALYRAKHAGRNRVEAAVELSGATSD